MSDWDRCLLVLEQPLSTCAAWETAVTRILALLAGGASCPPHVLGPLKSALWQLYPALNDTSMEDKVREAVDALGGRAKGAKQDPPTTPAGLLARMQDAKDDENLGFDLSATWASFAGSPAPKLKQASTCNSAPMGEPGCQTDAMSVGHAAPDVSGAFSIDAAAADRVSDVLRSPAPARMLLQKFDSPTVATAGAMQLEQFPVAAADRRRQPAASMRGRQVKNKLWRIGKDVGPWISGSGRRAVKCVEPQSQVLILNAYKQLQATPYTVRTLMSKHFKAKGFQVGLSLSARILSGLICMSAKTVANIVKHVEKHEPSKRPVIKRKRGEERMSTAAIARNGGAMRAHATNEAAPTLLGNTAPSVVDNAAHPAVPRGFLNLIRTCAFLSSRGIAKDALPHLVHIIVEAKGDVHTSYHTEHFVTVFDKVAHDTVAADTIQYLFKPLPATGRPPDVEFIADHGTIG